MQGPFYSVVQIFHVEFEHMVAELMCLPKLLSFESLGEMRHYTRAIIGRALCGVSPPPIFGFKRQLLFLHTYGKWERKEQKLLKCSTVPLHFGHVEGQRLLERLEAWRKKLRRN